MEAGVMFHAHGSAVCRNQGNASHPDVQTELAAFLIAAQEHAYYMSVDGLAPSPRGTQFMTRSSALPLPMQPLLTECTRALSLLERKSPMIQQVKQVPSIGLMLLFELFPYCF